MNETLHACQERFRTSFVMDFDLYRYSHGDLDSDTKPYKWEINTKEALRVRAETAQLHSW